MPVAVACVPHTGPALCKAYFSMRGDGPALSAPALRLRRPALHFCVQRANSAGDPACRLDAAHNAVPSAGFGQDSHPDSAERVWVQGEHVYPGSGERVRRRVWGGLLSRCWCVLACLLQRVLARSSRCMLIRPVAHMHGGWWVVVGALPLLWWSCARTALAACVAACLLTTVVGGPMSLVAWTASWVHAWQLPHLPPSLVPPTQRAHTAACMSRRRR